MGCRIILAVVLVLVVVLVLILVVVLIAVLVIVLVVALIVLIAVLVIHNRSSENLYLRHCRFHSVSDILAFILCFEKKACKESGGNRSGDATGTGF